MKKIFVILLVPVLFCSCLFNFVRGSGNIITEERAIDAGFSAVDMRVPGDLVLTDDDTSKATLSGDDNIVDLIDVFVSNGTLVIETDPGIWFMSHTLNIQVPSETLSAVTLSGSGRISGDHTLTAESLDITLAGSGIIDLDIDSDDTVSAIRGSGAITLHGSCGEYEAVIEGSGSIDAGGMTAADASAVIRGSGTISVKAMDTLSILIEGSGLVAYSGTAVLKSAKILGSGTFFKK